MLIVNEFSVCVFEGWTTVNICHIYWYIDISFHGKFVLRQLCNDIPTSTLPHWLRDAWKNGRTMHKIHNCRLTNYVIWSNLDLL